VTLWTWLQDNPIAVALSTAAIMWAAGWVRVFLAKRVRVHSPDSEAIAKIVPAVNMLIEIKGPELEMLVALGEAMQGKNNGNVTGALKSTRNIQERFDQYRSKAACIEVDA
jgi:hypothetical protein